MSAAKVVEEKQPFWAKCAGCNHCWICAYYPVELHLMGKILGGLHCPMCGADAKNIRVAKQENGKLLEPTS